ncbi:non-ribosomal peptide synthetase [Chengkuizengella marina]|uniref:Amino acid adenylation domain-containing protein n=1 Tax=Chengkuizengella marina TaxID=2507566 RepID=A0A6N9Q828_9BACL|nr:non-ribosomal peptide synthetase [Chengkuizengella marina]NBI31018.1 amino acid adenylation domain-containing protein [Chengkuizengella marina]
MLELNLLETSEEQLEESIKEVSLKDVAIIGISANLPMSPDQTKFWENLMNGKDCVHTFPKNRLKDIRPLVQKENNVQFYEGAYLEEIDKFDYKFFGLSPKEASLMNPNQRLFLENTWKTIEDAGYGGDKLKGSKTGVYVGYNADAFVDYKNFIAEVEPDALSMAIPGNLTSILASRISYLLDLKGPALCIDTACSSSLVAVHVACQAIQNGDCDQALVGSVNVNILPFDKNIKIGIESSDGRARTFDQQSDGTGAGEGSIALLLKPLSKAQQDRDHIYAVIKGSAVNQDGSSIGITAPNVLAQEEVIVKALQDADVNPETITYFEAHGTGTKLGDPIEIDAITRAYRKFTDQKQFCAIGAVKTNIGHLDNAAGIAGLLKAVLALHHAKIPPMLHFNQSNSEIDFISSPVFINSQLRKWEKTDYPRRAGVSAFGMSGTNCHVILEEENVYSEVIETQDQENLTNQSMNVFTLSAKSKTSLNSLIKQYKNFITTEEYVNLNDLCYTANTGRGHYTYRVAMLITDVEDFKLKLNMLDKDNGINQDYKNVYYGELKTKHKDKKKVEFTPSSDQREEKDLIETCIAYVHGEDIDWELFYDGEYRRKISLPTYCFENIRCWLELPEVENLQPEPLVLSKVERKVEIIGREYDKLTEVEKTIAQAWGEVLGFKEIDIQAPFYDLGGDSILALKIVNQISQKSNITVSVTDLLQHETIQKLAIYMEELLDQQLEEREKIEIPKVESSEVYHLSSAQKRMYILHQLDGKQTNYNMPKAMIIKGQLNQAKFEDALRGLISHHESLRTSFEMADGEPVQRIHTDIDFNIDYQKAEKDEIDHLISNFIQPFDLSQAPLFRVSLIQVDEEEHLFLFDIHHIISDGTSMHIIVSDFIKFYEEKTMPDLRIQYKDYAHWQNEQIIQGKLKKEEQYWSNQFADEVPILNLPTDYIRPVMQSFDGDRIDFHWDKKMTEKVNQLAKETNSTVYMVLLAAFTTLLSKYSGQEDIIVGSPIAGRIHIDIEPIMGMFANTLALRNTPKSNKTFKVFLQEVKESALHAIDHQNYPIENVIDNLSIQRDTSRNPLFSVLFNMLNMEIQDMRLEHLSFHPYPIKNKASYADIMLNVIEEGDGFLLSTEYCTKLFKKETIQQMIQHLGLLVEQVVEQPEIKLGDIELLSEGEVQDELNRFTETTMNYPKEKSVHALFEEQVEKTPDQIAVVFGDIKLSYTELNAKANQIAWYLKQNGVQTQSIVGIMVERSLDMIIGVLGILKAGAAYVPIDPDYPQKRIQYLLQHSNTSVLLTQHRMQSNLTDIESMVVCIEDVLQQLDLPIHNLELPYDPEQLIYVLYTSGSTGNPKGVMVKSHAFVNLLHWYTSEFHIHEQDKLLLMAPSSFDLAQKNLFSALIKGGQLHVYYPGLYDYNVMSDVVAHHGITLINCAPSAFYPLIDFNHDSQFARLKSLRKVFLGGEPINMNKLQSWLFTNKEVELVNTYGPTECTDVSSYYRVNKQDYIQTNVPIGKAVYNTELYIMDKNLTLMPTGVAGELCIGGTGLAKGYFNAGEITSEKFVENPYKLGEKVYRTGDLVKRLPDGNLEYLGRMDYQVKIRGMRIELEEIERQLLDHTDIEESIIVVKEEGTDKKLCAYVVCSKELNVTQLREYLSQSLPDFMIPAIFVQLEQMPLTPNGKVNRKALPEPDFNNRVGVEYVAPTNELESQLVSLWEEGLGVDKIGIKDNFFELGGHSLNAVQIVSKVQKKLGIQLSLTDIFTNTSIEKLVKRIEELDERDYSPISQVVFKEVYSLSSAQKRMFVLQQLESSTSYNLPSVLRIKGNLERNRFEYVLNSLIKRHESLRTSFEMMGGEPVQRIHDKINLDITYKNVVRQEVDQVVSSFIQPFDLSQAPLFRVNLMQIDTDEYIFLFDMHHIISDGTSMNILIKDFVQLYEGNSLSELHIQYKDFAAWQIEQTSTDRMKIQKQYWLERFSDEIPVLNLPTDYIRPVMQSFEGDRIDFHWGKNITNNLTRLAKETDSTLYIVLLTAYTTLLSKYTGQEDIIVGSPVAGRTHPDIESVMGMFVNTLAMRNAPEGHKTFKNLLEEVKMNVLCAIENESYPLEELIESLNLQRDTSRNPLFSVLFNMLNVELREMNREGLSFTPYPIENKVAKFDLTLTVIEEDEELFLSMEYCTKLFKKESIERMVNHLEILVGQILEQPEIRISDIDILPKQEKHQLLVEFNNTSNEYPKGQMIHGLFEQQVEKTPNNIAVVYEDQQLTYRELNEKANQLARTLREKMIQSETIVGIMAERSIEMIIGIYAILKAGGAYLPIDPNYPEERIQFIIKDSGINTLLVQDECMFNPTNDLDVVNLKDESIYHLQNNNLDNNAENSQLAYVIYTSGSTGNPKGVLVEHKSVINTLLGMQDAYPLNENDTYLLKTTFTFDVSVTELFGYYLCGGKLAILKNGKEKDPYEILSSIAKYNVTHINFVPSMFNSLLSILNVENISMFNVLKYVFLAGEAVPSNIADDFYKLTSQVELKNIYGPTETTIYATKHEITHQVGANVPIGRPLNNVQCYILDKYSNLCPVGVAGELHISGVGVARGYLNRSELTKKQFVDNPYQPEGKLYKTGDLTRWLPDGSIEYLGRLDHQVKIRGFRIELGEIEHQLIQHSEIKECLVTVKEDEAGDKTLCAYLISNRKMNIKELREFALASLPDYMIPTYFIQLEEMPLTSSGKIDRKSLQESEVILNSDIEYLAPRNELENQLVYLWETILEVEGIGIQHNFFELGGHSLKALQFISTMHKEMKILMDLNELFMNPTIEQLSRRVQQLDKSEFVSIPKAGSKEVYPLSPSQKQLFVLQQLDVTNTSYNIPSVMVMKGVLNRAKFEEAVHELILRHESLRTTFEMKDEEPVQRIHDQINYEIHFRSLVDIELNEFMSELIKPFHLSEGPLFRIILIEKQKDEHLFFIDMHHIIADGVSINILVKDFIKLYQKITLPALRIQYKDYAVWKNEQFNSTSMNAQEKFWLERYKGNIPVLNLPTDFERPKLQSFEGDQFKFKLEKEVVEQLREVLQTSESTMFMLLLTIYNVLLYKITGQEDIIVGTPVAGRAHADLNQVMGAFVNTLAMRNFPKGDKTIRSLLSEVKEETITAFSNQEYPFEKLVEELDMDRDLSRNPLFDTMFVFQNFDQEKLIMNDIEIEPYELQTTISKFDLMLVVNEEDDKLSLNVEFATQLFTKETIQKIFKYYEHLLNNITQNLDIKIDEIEGDLHPRKENIKTDIYEAPFQF